MYYSFNNSGFPVIKLSIVTIPNNEQELEQLFTDWYKYYSYKQDMIFLIDVSRLSGFNMEFTKRIIEFSNSIRSLPPYIYLTIFYFTSDIFKNIFNMVMTCVKKPIRPILITKDREVINDILMGHLEFANVNDYTIKYPEQYTLDHVVNETKRLLETNYVSIA
tara:strand:+ start:119 stop:607 length:489 start_codon:yes stop_codon:yes gene_type:complete